MTMRKNLLWLIKQYFFRAKSLNYVIWILITAICGELKAIGNSEVIYAFLEQRSPETEAGQILEALIKFFLTDGSYFVLAILISLFLFICFLKNNEIKSEQKKQHSNESKEELFLSVINLIKCTKIIDSEKFIAIVSLINNKDLSNKLNYYYSFERKRGNINSLEQYVKTEKLVECLLKYKSNEL